MRRIFLSLTSVLASTTLMFGVASAQSTSCDIVNTGPNSTNICSVSDNNNLKVTCKNNTDVVFVNNQSANSGDVTLQKNTNGGYAYSGNAVNTNSTTGKLDVSCGAKVASAPAPAPTPTPAPSPSTSTSTSTSKPASPAASQSTEEGGQGQAASSAQALPETGSNTAVSTTIAAASILGVVAVAARLGFSAYRHFSLR
jgi:hypothetical protein